METNQHMSAKLFNPTNKDIEFKWDGQVFTSPARTKKQFAYFLAQHGARYIADEILRNEGRYKDVIKDGKPVGLAISKTKREEIASKLVILNDEIETVAEAEPVPEVELEEKAVETKDPDAVSELSDLSEERLRIKAKELKVRGSGILNKDKLIEKIEEKLKK